MEELEENLSCIQTIKDGVELTLLPLSFRGDGEGKKKKLVLSWDGY